MAAVEGHLLEIARIPAGSGHPLHRGTPREAFIKEFLATHLSETVAIGTGEIIDAESKPRDNRSQVDIVVYRRNFPKLAFGGGISGFLVESVVSIIEVKSLLNKDELRTAIATAAKVKQLQPNLVHSFRAGYQPPAILSYIVAYDGPAKMETIYDWLAPIHAELGITMPLMPPDANARVAIPSPSIDGLFLLGKGFLYFDNTPMGFVSDDLRSANPTLRWIFADTERGSLLLLFAFLTQAVSGVAGSWVNAVPYLSGFSVSLNFGP